MKLIVFLATLAHIPWALSLNLRKLEDDAQLVGHASSGVNLRHRSLNTSKGTFTLHHSVDRNVDHSVARNSPVAKKANKENESMLQPMLSTAHGICMYQLPARFNVGLLNSTFKQPVPQPLNISPANDPPLQGMFDTIQFSLERIFYDRFLATADQMRPAKDCVMFYVPYFVAWETSSVQNTWLNAYRPELDEELIKHLAHYNATGVPGRNHFIVIGRISFSLFHLLQRNGPFDNMVKLVLEDTAPGQYTNVFAIPYPTWFRYYPGLEPSSFHAGSGSSSTIKVTSVAVNLQQDVKGCNPTWLGNLTSRMQDACNGREFCSYHILPELDKWVVGKIYEAMDANGKWWPVTIKDKNEDGTFSVQVHDGPGSKWPKVFRTHMRRNGQLASAAAHDTTVKCPALDVSGQYSCGDSATYTFKSLPGEAAVGHALALGCPAGPCWLWGICHHRGPNADPLARTGPLLSFIGSARATEYERRVVFKMCEERPLLCSVFDTGPRENSTSFVHNRIADMYQLLMASTFCVNPPGDTPTRKGLFDSLVLGCIPVVTSEDSLQHYQFHLPFWRSVSLLVTTEQLFSANFNLVDYLESYEQSHAEDIAQKQEAIRKYAYSLQYSFAPATTVRRGPDAFDKTLENLLARPLSAPNQQDFEGFYSIVNVASKRRLYATSDGDYATGFGANTGDKVASAEWRIVGKGDGTCCYALENVASKRALYAQVNATEWSKLGASTTYNAAWADQKWRLSPKGFGTYAIVNVASGRRLFTLEGHEENIGVGATLGSPNAKDQRWRLEKVM